MANDFGRAAADAVLDLTGDDDQELRKQRSLMIWDRKKKKFVGQVSLLIYSRATTVSKDFFDCGFLSETVN